MPLIINCFNSFSISVQLFPSHAMSKVWNVINAIWLFRIFFFPLLFPVRFHSNLNYNFLISMPFRISNAQPKEYFFNNFPKNQLLAVLLHWFQIVPVCFSHSSHTLPPLFMLGTQLIFFPSFPFFYLLPSFPSVQLYRFLYSLHVYIHLFWPVLSFVIPLILCVTLP